MVNSMTKINFMSIKYPLHKMLVSLPLLKPKKIKN